MSALEERLRAEYALGDAQARRIAGSMERHAEAEAQNAAPAIPETAYPPEPMAERSAPLPPEAARPAGGSAPLPPEGPYSAGLPAEELFSAPAPSDEERISAAARRAARLAPDMEQWGEGLS